MMTEHIFNGRNGIVLLLVTMLIIFAAMPALAWFDEGVAGWQPVRPCRVISTSEGPRLISCGQAEPHFSPMVIRKQPPIHPAVVRAEQMFERNGMLAQVLAEY